MSKENRIAIIIAAFNAEDYIERCIQSIQKQTYPNWIAYIVNDGSSDNTSEVLAAIRLKEERVVYLDIENSGVFCARRKAIEMVENCKYLTFLDSDDYFVDDELFEKCIDKMELNNIDCLCFNYERYDGILGFKSKNEVIWTEKEEIIKNLLNGQYMDGNMPYTIYLTENIKENFEIYSYNNDDFLNKYKILLDTKKVAYEPWCGYHYYYNKKSQTHRDLRENDYLYYEHAKSFVKKIEEDYPELQIECDYFRCKVLLWLAGKLSQKKLYKKFKMYGFIMQEFRDNKKIFVKNSYFTKKDKLLFYLIQMRLFGICYKIYHAIQ
ncbi:MAG: glycosyltransferase family 2 protein [Lachnospiraceae bacterium]|nr:glycosyltransferase family 2 protein [Lachnospiraceae bacterium]